MDSPAPTAVAAGKDELKQTAKRVRELKRKPREEAPPQEADTGVDEVQALRQRVAELTAENTELRRQIAQLQASLPADSPPF